MSGPAVTWRGRPSGSGHWLRYPLRISTTSPARTNTPRVVSDRLQLLTGECAPLWDVPLTTSAR
jgi:hypothetical protein